MDFEDARMEDYRVEHECPEEIRADSYPAYVQLGLSAGSINSQFNQIKDKLCRKR